MEELIVNKASELFFSYGLKSVSMDDLAKGAGISKKTIYQSVTDKNELVQKVVDAFMQCHKKTLVQCSVEAKNAVEEVVLHAHQSYSVLAAVNYSFFYELEKFFPDVWRKVLDYRQQSLLPFIAGNIERGIREDYYRADVNIPFLTDVRLQQITTALNPKTFTDKITDAQKLMLQLTEFYLHGITNNKGKKLITKYIKDNQLK